MGGCNDSSESRGDRWFTTTHWTVVLGAGSDDTNEAAQALGELCKTYWNPIRGYIARTWRNPSDADDLTQQFFARFLEKKHYRLADRQRGKFRSFLLTSVKHFLLNEWERASAQKRGGGERALSLDEATTEGGQPRIEIRDDRTAEHIYEQTWALTLLSRVRQRLEADYADNGKEERFALLEKFLPGEETDLTYAEAAARLGVAEGTIKSDVHRLKRRYRELLREEIAHTVATPEQIEDELRHLITVVGQRRG